MGDIREAAVTPGVKRRVEDLVGEILQAITAPVQAQYRALAARVNYLALDRADIALAVKECCRQMSNPKRIDWVALRRLVS